MADKAEELAAVLITWLHERWSRCEALHVSEVAAILRPHLGERDGKILVDKSLLDGIRRFMNMRFDSDRLLQHQLHYIREIDRVLPAPPAEEER